MTNTSDERYIIKKKMKNNIKCPFCDAEFEVEMPDYLRDADCMYEGKVRCENCNNMVTVFTNPQVISEPINKD